MTATTAPQSKSGWPLLALAVLAFLPLFGFFFGAGAVTWALLSDRPRAKLALGIGAAGGILNIVGLVAVSMFMQNDATLQRTQAQLAQADLGKIVAAVDQYHERSGSYPPNLLALVGYPIRHMLLNVYDQTGGITRMRLYEYRVSADGTSYDLFAVGPDGKPYSSDDVRPVIPDSLVTTTGYHPVLR